MNGLLFVIDRLGQTLIELEKRNAALEQALSELRAQQEAQAEKTKREAD